MAGDAGEHRFCGREVLASGGVQARRLGYLCLGLAFVLILCALIFVEIDVNPLSGAAVLLLAVISLRFALNGLSSSRRRSQVWDLALATLRAAWRGIRSAPNDRPSRLASRVIASVYIGFALVPLSLGTDFVVEVGRLWAALPRIAAYLVFVLVALIPFELAVRELKFLRSGRPKGGRSWVFSVACVAVALGVIYVGSLSLRGISWLGLLSLFDYWLENLVVFASALVLAILPLRLALFEAGRMRNGMAKAV